MAEISYSRKLVAECVGTGALTYVGAGSAAATGVIAKSTGVAFSMAQLGVISFAFMLVIVGVVYALGHVSGAHINPAVTVALAVKRLFPWREVPGYVGAQIVGAVLGAVAIWGTLGAAGTRAGLGVTAYSADVNTGRAFFAELIGTFLLVLVVLGAIDSRAPAGWAGMAIGAIVFAVIIIVGPATGAAINPARYIGPVLVQEVSGGAVKWAQLPVYWIAELAGAVLAAALYGFLGAPGREPAVQLDDRIPARS